MTAFDQATSSKMGIGFRVLFVTGSFAPNNSHCGRRTQGLQLVIYLCERAFDEGMTKRQRKQ
jgi:hypothetical protein